MVRRWTWAIVTVFSVFQFWPNRVFAQDSISVDFTNPSDYPGIANFDINSPESQYIGGYAGPYSLGSSIQGPVIVSASGYYCYPDERIQPGGTRCYGLEGVYAGYIGISSEYGATHASLNLVVATYTAQWYPPVFSLDVRCKSSSDCTNSCSISGASPVPNSPQLEISDSGGTVDIQCPDVITSIEFQSGDDYVFASSITIDANPAPKLVDLSLGPITEQDR